MFMEENTHATSKYVAVSN